VRKFFYLFICEYCFSRYIAFSFLLPRTVQTALRRPAWFVIAGFALIWVANQYMSLYNRLRLDSKGEKIEHELMEEENGRESKLVDGQRDSRRSLTQSLNIQGGFQPKKISATL